MLRLLLFICCRAANLDAAVLPLSYFTVNLGLGPAGLRLLPFLQATAGIADMDLAFPVFSVLNSTGFRSVRKAFESCTTKVTQTCLSSAV